MQLSPGGPLVVLLLALAACAPPRAAPLPPGPGVSVLTYNVNFERFDPATVEAIAAVDADVVFLQETTREWEIAIRARLARVYPTMEFRHHDPDGGQAVLARGAVATHDRRTSPVGSFPAWCVVVDTAVGPLQVLHVHLHPPLDERGLISGYFTTGGLRRAEMEDYLGCFSTPPDLIVGDFNEEEGDAVDLIAAQGLLDAAAAFPPPRRTWEWDHWSGQLVGRPDHVFHAAALVAASVAVREAGASDHRPLTVELRRR
ncbi:MAG: endonuclease/exonuclease/phosphatase family protein [Pseudomonadota bacterium]|nr:endonuclease/exonuclease/phosphatase family protein [Pseudomonadota bacterium]